jgi:hypothetical protein
MVSISAVSAVSAANTKLILEKRKILNIKQDDFRKIENK